MDAELKWLRGLLDSGVLPWHHGSRFNEVKAQSFFEHARAQPGLNRWHDTDFADFLKRWGCERKRNNGSWWVFPPLRNIRQKWRADMPWSPAFDRPNARWESSVDADDFEDG